jgi:hypothetical protein
MPSPFRGRVGWGLEVEDPLGDFCIDEIAKL